MQMVMHGVGVYHVSVIPAGYNSGHAYTQMVTTRTDSYVMCRQVVLLEFGCVNAKLRVCGHHYTTLGVWRLVGQ